MKISQTNRGAMLCAQAELTGIVDLISEFDRKTRAEEYTDTGDAWLVLYQIRRDARRALRELRRGK